MVGVGVIVLVAVLDTELLDDKDDLVENDQLGSAVLLGYVLADTERREL